MELDLIQRRDGLLEEAARRFDRLPAAPDRAAVLTAIRQTLNATKFIQGLLLEEGVPSLLRRSAGFDVPDFLAAGPRDVLVPQTGVSTAREVLLQAEIIGPERPTSTVDPRRLLLGLLAALAIGALIIWGATIIIHP